MELTRILRPPKSSANAPGKVAKEVAGNRGKVWASIGYVPGTMHHILLMETLQMAGLDINKDVTLKRIDFFDMKNG
ncbi:hypothetical protein [Peptoclostridium sp.]|uniref:hypothetical protein n=1 Tax=Peptoclostridium sp. TaxID=1904860 RepID=UPI0025D38078|nr:hypothetical protein [Peptoclostridium sp.]